MKNPLCGDYYCVARQKHYYDLYNSDIKRCNVVLILERQMVHVIRNQLELELESHPFKKKIRSYRICFETFFFKNQKFQQRCNVLRDVRIVSLPVMNLSGEFYIVRQTKSLLAENRARSSFFINKSGVQIQFWVLLGQKVKRGIWIPKIDS